MSNNTPAPADLLPCPFCGGEAEMDHYQPFRNYRTGAPLDQVAIYCTVCNAQISHYPGDLSLSREETAEIVVAEWNRRAAAITPQPDARDAEQAWKCAAMACSDPNGPQDCGWPMCGCDPYAEKVIEAISESGITPAPDPHDAEIERLREALKGIMVRLGNLGLTDARGEAALAKSEGQ